MNWSGRAPVGVLVVMICLASRLVADEAKPAKKPVGPDHAFVPGFARFYDSPDADLAAGGLLLWGELNCSSCHRSDPSSKIDVHAKQAPLLGDAGRRINPEYLRRFIANPHQTKPGTTMPALFAAHSGESRTEAVEPLVHYLVSLSDLKFKLSAPGGEAVARGEVLFHQSGCVACHAPRRGGSAELDKTSVPLGLPETKYSVASLTRFLSDPLKIRPSGRMPNMALDEGQALDLASYLLEDADVPASLNYAYYEGNWPKVPDFAALKPKHTGQAHAFHLGVRRRNNQFALAFDGFLDIERAGEYKFWVTSDDGTRLFIDGTEVVNNDGTHPPQTREGKVTLAEGVHEIHLGYHQGGGEYVLKVELQGPGLSRRVIPSTMLRSTREPPKKSEAFVLDKSLAAKGREMFTSVGCADCHQLGGEHSALVSRAKHLAVATLKAMGGCLSAAPGKRHPQYALSERQQAALAAALDVLKAGKPRAAAPKDEIVATMTRLNCYACHERDQRGGVLEPRRPYFTANQPDLGDEGRLPPLLTGVGDKLRGEWLEAVLTKQGVARPYMDARMPQFGAANLGKLAELLTRVDRVPDTLPKTPDNAKVAKRAGHQLVGKGGLTCISCHMFNRHRSLGIQATDLARMPERIRKDWFRRYMLNPQPFRPGTRMPASWPNGQSFKPDILDGNSDRQILAIYDYLADGRRAIKPEGITRQSMELIVGGEAVIYRNFIQGAGARAICVGHPELVNVAFDANELRLALIWQGRFIDASKHWSGRGQGFQPPLGEKVISLVGGAPLAVLESGETAWPKESGKAAGYQFRGYRLDALRRPTFLYDLGDIRVQDFAEGRENAAARWLVRTMTLTAKGDADKLWYRAAAGGKIEKVDSATYRINDQLVLKFPSANPAPLLRTSGNQPELIVPIVFDQGKAELVEEFHW